MIRDVDIISYLPSVIADIKVINIAMAAESKEFVLIWKATDKVLKNEFITSADEYGIAEFEKILHILPSVNDTLEVRRARVQAGWFAALPYTWRMFVQKIMEICGTTYPVSIMREESYMVNLEAGIELQWQIESLIDMVEKMLPCNMGIAVKNVLPLDLETSAPAIKPGWFGYRVEYRGEIIADENILIIKAVCIHVLMPFWGGGTYNGRRRYDGSMWYNAKRNYALRVIMKSILQLYTEQAVRYAVVFGGHIQHKADADVFTIFNYCIRLKEMMQVSTGIYTDIQSPSGDVGNLSIETKRNVVRYNGARRYNRAMKYNALYRKEQIE